MKRTLYIEKKEGVGLDEVLALEQDRSGFGRSASNVIKLNKNDETFTLNGSDVTFLAFEVEGSEDELKRACRVVIAKFNAMVMLSGLADKTKIEGVIRRGNHLFCDGEEYLVETEVYDERCCISFPLVTQRRINDKITFVPLNLALPTDFASIERRIESMYVLEGAKNSKMQYIQRIATPIAVATAIYPRQLIWKYSEVPPQIHALLVSLMQRGAIPNAVASAIAILSETEKEYLEMDLYIGDFAESLEEHILPIESVIPPNKESITRSTRQRRTVSDLETSIADKIQNADTLIDIGNVSKEVQDLADQILGEGGNKQIDIRKKRDGVEIRLKKGDSDD